MDTMVEKLPDNDTYYMGIAMAVRQKANCKGHRVGAVLVLENRVISTGYNGTPEGMPNCLDGGCLRCVNRGHKLESGQAYDLCICVHAEQNALLTAARFGIAVQNGTLFTTMQPCFGCAKERLQAQVKEIVYLHEWRQTEVDPEMNHQKKKEYGKITKGLNPRQIFLDDPRAVWAVSTLRKKPKLV